MLARSKLYSVAAAVALVATSGCATNAIRVEYAGNVAAQGKAATNASREFLARVEQARQEANIELVSADPICGRSPARVRPEPNMAAAPRPGWLCGGAGGILLNLRAPHDDLQPTFALVESIASYADALTEIVDADPLDPAQELTDALETARAAQGALVAVLGGTGPVPASDDPRVAAVTGFIGFLGELQDEATTVKKLRKLLAENPQGAEGVVRVLRDQLRTWENSRKADELLRQTVNTALLRSVIEKNPPATPAERREALTSWYSRDATRRASARIQPALDAVLATLGQADQDMRRVLRENPDLKPAERRKIAELNRKRIIRALDLFTSLVTSFRGA